MNIIYGIRNVYALHDLTSYFSHLFFHISGAFGAKGSEGGCSTTKPRYFIIKAAMYKQLEASYQTGLWAFTHNTERKIVQAAQVGFIYLFIFYFILFIFFFFCSKILQILQLHVRLGVGKVLSTGHIWPTRLLLRPAIACCYNFLFFFFFLIFKRIVIMLELATRGSKTCLSTVVLALPAF